MEKIKIIHDVQGSTLTIWLDDPQKEAICEETSEEVILMKDSSNRIIGFELLHYEPYAIYPLGLTVETIIAANASLNT
ncbi:MAG: DUF2283 domain-containing protein [Candidatus Eremiobacteraeota bacterium]|nr:DUF2283 domain-containing protein [Candidatus Eremiobacteraeota bacterium]